MQKSTTSLSNLDRTLIALIVVITLIARIIPSPRNVDDSYITFRYSRNIVEGNGFVYNPGEKVLGTTTPTYTLIMAAISVITGQQDFPWYALVVNTLADSTTAVLLLLIVRRVTKNRWAGFLIGILWALSPWSITFAIGGMETSVAVLFMIATVYCYLTDRYIWMGILAGLGFLTRVDALIWIGLLFLSLFYEFVRNMRLSPTQQTEMDGLEVPRPVGTRLALSERFRVRAGITQLPIIKTFSAFIITILPWLIWSTLYFGSPIPHSIAAKVATLTVSPGGAFSFMLPRLTTPFLESDVFGFVGTLVALVLYIALSAISLLYAIRNAPRLLPVLIFPWVYLAVFSIANPLIFRWYLIPPMPALILSILIGLYALITSGKPSRQRTFTVALTIAGAVWIICALNAWTLHPDHSPDRPAPKMAWHMQELDYQQAALELVEKYGVTPTTTIAAPDIGAVGYFSRAHIIDTVGLVSPQVMKYYPMSKGIVPEPFTYAIPPQLILDMQPDYIVVMEAAVRLGLEKNVDFKTLYGDPIILIPTDFYGTDMRVYKRK